MSASVLANFPVAPSKMLLGAIFLGAIAYLVRAVLKIGSRPANLPPGPPTVPFWGNLKQLSGTLYPERVYTEWAKEYGPVYTVMKGSQPWIIVTGAAEAQEIFHKRGQETGGRPTNRMELAMRSGFFPSFMSGPKWRITRKLWHSVLNVGASRQYLPLQELETKQLMADLARDSKAWRAHIDRFAGSVGMTLVNGQRVTSSTDRTSREIVDDLTIFSQHSIRSGWLDKMPVVWDLPEWMVPARKIAAGLAADHMAMIMRHWNTTKRRLAEGLSIPCFNRTMMERLEHGNLQDRVSEAECAEIGELLVTAATDTSSSSLQNWVAAMALFPDVQKKAQEEIDAVVGPDRLPDATDAPNLPYVRQVIQELQRWLTVAPLGVTHATTEPFRWGAYTIPADTPLVINAYGIHRDPAVYPNPTAFDPDRWAGHKLDQAATAALMADDNDDGHRDRVGARSELFAFGAGRRVCPGQHVAERGLFLAVARWLWGFEVGRPAKAGPSGDEVEEIDVDACIRPGLVVCLEGFEAEVRPRSAARAHVVADVWERDRAEFLDREGQWKRSPAGVESVMTGVKTGVKAV